MAAYMARNAIAFIPAAAIIVVVKYLGATPVMILATSAILVSAYYAHVIRTDSASRELFTGLLRKFVPETN